MDDDLPIFSSPPPKSISSSPSRRLPLLLLPVVEEKNVLLSIDDRGLLNDLGVPALPSLGGSAALDDNSSGETTGLPRATVYRFLGVGLMLVCL